MTQLFCVSYACLVWVTVTDVYRQCLVWVTVTDVYRQCLVWVTVTDVYRHFQQCLSYRGGQLYFFKKPEYRQKTSDTPQIADIHFIIQCYICNTSSKFTPTHTITAYKSIHYAIADHHCHCGRCFDNINFQGRCHSNYHMIMATTPPVLIARDIQVQRLRQRRPHPRSILRPTPAVYLDNVCLSTCTCNFIYNTAHIPYHNISLLKY